MSLSTNALCRYGSLFVRSLTQSKWAPVTTARLARYKSDKAEQTGEMVVEKEKQDRKYGSEGKNWNKIPEKLTEIKEHLKEPFRHPTEQKARGRSFRDDEVLYYFREEKDLEHWFTVTDSNVGGKSWAEFVQGENGMTATFRGYMSQKLPNYLLPSSHDKLEQKQIYNGFAYVQTKPFLSVAGREDFMSIYGFNTFEMRLRGDGRAYKFEALCDWVDNKHVFTFPVHTRGGPEWQTVTIPYNKMIASKHSGLLAYQHEIDVQKIKFFRFLLMDGIQGPFQLEIDYIALRRDYTEAAGGTDYWDPYKHTNTMLGTW